MAREEKQGWKAYWKSSDKSFIERLIQGYKAKAGYARLLKAIPEIRDSGLSLEVGAGKAWLSRLLFARGFKTSAVDLDLDVAKASADKVGNYVIADMFCLPFKDGIFDLVLSCGLLEHLDTDQIKKGLFEMLRTGKAIAAWIPDCGWTWKAAWFIRNMLGADVFEKVYPYTQEKIGAIFKDSGLSNVRTGIITFAGIFNYIYVYGTKDNAGGLK